MSRILAVKVGPLAAASATNIALSQSPGAAGNLTLNGSLVSGGVATLDTPRRVIVTSGGNDTGITFTAYGTDFAGYPLLAAVAGASGGAADFGVSFKTITRIAISAAAASTVTVGTNTVADSVPLNLDEFGFPVVSLQVNVSGTVNYTVNSTIDDFTNPNWIQGTGGTASAFSNATWVNSSDSAVVSAMASKQSNYSYVPKWVRVTLNSGIGSISLQVIQAASPSR